MLVSPTVLGQTIFLIVAVVGMSGCANEPKLAPSLAPMMIGGPAAAATAPVSLTGSLTGIAAAASAPDTLPPGNLAPDAFAPENLARKSLAAKVLAARALETVTGLKTDPARLSEHD